MTEKTVVLYHDKCADGFGAAWAVWKSLGNIGVQYLPVSYNEPPPPKAYDCEILYIVDFSYDQETLLDLAKEGGPSKIVVIDHHKTAQAALEPEEWRELTIIEVVFDMSKSGAVLTWEYFHDEPVPLLLHYVQDRDLWQWKMPDSKAVSAYLRSAAWEFEKWDHIDAAMRHVPGMDAIIIAGQAVLAGEDAMVELICKEAYWRHVGDHLDAVVAVNTPVLQSECCDYLKRKYPRSDFIAAYFDKADGRRLWSLRSDPPFDVSVVAKEVGGGGHAQAAGFTEDHHHEPWRLE